MDSGVYLMVYDEWKSGNKSEEIQRGLLEYGLEQYRDSGVYNVELVELICKKANKGGELTRMDRRTIQDLYECLESENFHTEIEAIELFTGIKYV